MFIEKAMYFVSVVLVLSLSAICIMDMADSNPILEQHHHHKLKGKLVPYEKQGADVQRDTVLDNYELIVRVEDTSIQDMAATVLLEHKIPIRRGGQQFPIEFDVELPDELDCTDGATSDFASDFYTVSARIVDSKGALVYTTDTAYSLKSSIDNDNLTLFLLKIKQPRL